MRKALSLALALGAAMLAACGGGTGVTGSSGALVPGPAGQSSPDTVSITIKIPSASSASTSRRPHYISPGTQSIGVVVTDQGATPSPAQFVNVSSCPQVSGVTTCTIGVLALPGTDMFAITAYSAPNGGGSALSVGSISSTIVAGVANTTLPLTLGGIVASITITPGTATLPLGQSTTLNIVAKDTSGAAIVGAFDNPVTLTGSNLAFSSTALADSTAASSVTIAWQYGFASSTASTVTATADGVNGTQTITPGTGYAYYTTGSNPTYDNAGFKMIAGSNGDLYYTTLGILTCTNTVGCLGQAAAVHQFNPVTATDTEVDVPSEMVGLHFSSDGALWIAGGTPTSAGAMTLYRMAPGAFSSAALTAIPVPTPTTARANVSVRSVTEDGSGNMWFVDFGGRRYMSIPAAGPYQASSITFYSFPNGLSGTAQQPGSARTIDYAGGMLVAGDVVNGSVDVINPSTGAVTGQYLSNLQTSFSPYGAYTFADEYDSTTDGSQAYIAQLGNNNLTIPQGDLEAFNPITNTFTTEPVVQGPVGVQPTVPSVNGTLLQETDFSLGGIDTINLSTGATRLVPVIPNGGNPFTLPSDAAAMPDGTVWFACYAEAQIFQPMCLGHSVYLSGWSVFPGTSIAIFGAGLPSAQIMGIMEAPSANSGPFTVTSGNTSVCTIANASDHNFTIVGQSAGACTVTVTDKNNVLKTIDVTVTTTTGTVQIKHRGGVQ